VIYQEKGAVAVDSMTLFLKEPTTSGYYYIFPKRKNDLLDSAPEIAYLYYDGKMQLFRLKDEHTKIEDIQFWYGPIEEPAWPKEIQEWLKELND
jgi:hypothetical protein